MPTQWSRSPRDHLEQLGAAARERRDQHAIARPRVARVVDPVLAAEVVARATAREQLRLEQAVGARHAPAALDALDPPLVLELAQHPPQRAQLVAAGAEDPQQPDRGLRPPRPRPASAPTTRSASSPRRAERAAASPRSLRARSPATLRLPGQRGAPFQQCTRRVVDALRAPPSLRRGSPGWRNW